jgi:hypothetical protein
MNFDWKLLIPINTLPLSNRIRVSITFNGRKSISKITAVIHDYEKEALLALIARCCEIRIKVIGHSFVSLLDALARHLLAKFGFKH